MSCLNWHWVLSIMLDSFLNSVHQTHICFSKAWGLEPSRLHRSWKKHRPITDQLLTLVINTTLLNIRYLGGKRLEISSQVSKRLLPLVQGQARTTSAYPRSLASEFEKFSGGDIQSFGGTGARLYIVALYAKWIKMAYLYLSIDDLPKFTNLDFP